MYWYWLEVGYLKVGRLVLVSKLIKVDDWRIYIICFIVDIFVIFSIIFDVIGVWVCNCVVLVVGFVVLFFDVFYYSSFIFGWVGLDLSNCVEI